MSYLSFFELHVHPHSLEILTFTAGAALIILIAPKRAKAAGVALLLRRMRLVANDATAEGKRIIILM